MIERKADMRFNALFADLVGEEALGGGVYVLGELNLVNSTVVGLTASSAFIPLPSSRQVNGPPVKSRERL